MDDAPLPGSRPTLAGNVPDPDAAVLDSLVEQHAEPPTPDALPVGIARPTVEPVRTSRLLTTSLAVQSSWEPVLLLPADPRRVSLQLWAASDTSSDYVRVSDDAGKLQTRQGSALLYSGQLLALQEAHTGPVWVYAPDATGPVTVSVIAVTR